MAGERLCKKCGETKPFEEFYADKGCRDGRRPECKACNLADQKARHAANPGPARERARRWNQENRERYNARMRQYRESGRKAMSDRKSHLKRKYGLTIEEYDELLAAQGGGCAICGSHSRDDISLHVDHCHETNEIRGILCFRCNNALGDFLHDVDMLERAVTYLNEALDRRIRARVDALVAERRHIAS